MNRAEMAEEERNKETRRKEVPEQSRKIFDELSAEIYYGFNMRLILNELIVNGNGSEIKVIENFIKQCKAGRKG